MEEVSGAKLPPIKQRATPHEEQRLLQIHSHGSLPAQVLDDRLVELGWLVRDITRSGNVDLKVVKVSGDYCDAAGRPKWIDAWGKFRPEWSRDAIARTDPNAPITLFKLTGVVLGILIAWDVHAVVSAALKEGTVEPMAVRLVAESVAIKLVMLCVLEGLHRIIENSKRGAHSGM